MNLEGELPVILARAAIHPMRSPQLQALAIRLIEAGFETPELHDLAWDSVINTPEAQALFEAALPKIGWRLPSRREAVSILLHHYCSLIAHEQADRFDTFGTLCAEAIYPEMYACGSVREAGDTHDMNSLIEAFYIYDDLMDRTPSQAEFSHLLAMIRSHAMDRLSRHPSAPSLRLLS